LLATEAERGYKQEAASELPGDLEIAISCLI